MPELPEVETTRRGIEPWCLNHKITRVEIWQKALRWPVPDDIANRVEQTTIHGINRRGKYLILHCDEQCLLIHLGMSGSLRVANNNDDRRKHDHWQIALSNQRVLRYHDPRRFGALLICHESELNTHKLLTHLGPEPLFDEFDGTYLYRKSRGKTQAVKNFIMDSQVVVGVGNIYAAEALFTSGIHPARAAGKISQHRYNRLANEIKQVLNKAIESGGTTLRDYVNGSGNPGYFSQQLNVYGKPGQPCTQCGKPVKSILLGQRSSFFCGNCQR